jgi:copper chaperone CopZ
MAKIKLNVSGMHCNSCKIILSEDLKDLGARNIEISLDEKKKIGKVSCDFNDKDKVIEVINKEGYKVIK